MITLNATHQQTKRITDNSTSTYQTVLTISQSVDQSDIPGLYSCTVENARGRSSRAVVIPSNGELIPYVHTLLGQFIGPSVREPHTSELNGGFSLIYINMYICISYVVHCSLYFSRCNLTRWLQAACGRQVRFLYNLDLFGS